MNRLPSKTPFQKGINVQEETLSHKSCFSYENGEKKMATMAIGNANPEEETVSHKSCFSCENGGKSAKFP